MQKFHHGKPSWNFPIVWTNQAEISIPCKRVENINAIDNLRQPGLNMIDCARGFKLEKQILLKAVTEDSLGNSAQNGKLHIISLVDVWLDFKWGSAPRLILQN